jgi:hypothetical protein
MEARVRFKDVQNVIMDYVYGEQAFLNNSGLMAEATQPLTWIKR